MKRINYKVKIKKEEFIDEMDMITNINLDFNKKYKNLRVNSLGYTETFRDDKTIEFDISIELDATDLEIASAQVENFMQ